MLPPGSPAVHLPDGARYSCLGCGRSCTDFDEVEIDRDTAERLRRLPLFHPELDLPASADGRLPYTETADRERLTLLRVTGPEGVDRCVFLDRQRRCALHVAHGREAKPATCRGFPFHLADTPGGTFVGLSFACSAILAEHGAALDEAHEDLREALAGAAGRDVLGEQILIAPGVPIGWDEYLAIEDRLTVILRGTPDVGEALFEQSLELRRSAASLGMRIADECPRLPEPRLRQAVLGWLEALARAPGDPPGRSAPMESRKEEAATPQPETDGLLRRWVEHRLFRKDLLRGPDLFLAHGRMLADYALVRQQGEADLAEGVRRIEQRFGLHARVTERLCSERRTLQALARAVRAPNFPAAMALAGGGSLS